MAPFDPTSTFHHDCQNLGCRKTPPPALVCTMYLCSRTLATGRIFYWCTGGILGYEGERRGAYLGCGGSTVHIAEACGSLFSTSCWVSAGTQPPPSDTFSSGLRERQQLLRLGFLGAALVMLFSTIGNVRSRLPAALGCALCMTQAGRRRRIVEGSVSRVLRCLAKQSPLPSRQV